MEQLHNIKTERISFICVTIKLTLDYVLNGTSQLRLMGKVHVMGLEVP